MRSIIPALLALLANQACAQNVVSMERLFTTPSERAQLDTQRNQAPASAPGASTGASAVGGAAGVEGGAAGSGVGAASPCIPGVAPGCPAAESRSNPGGTFGAMGAEQGAQEAPGLRLGGVITRSNGPAALILNGEVQPAPAGAVARGAVTLQQDGRSIVLKPGQRYDPATGAIREAER